MGRIETGTRQGKYTGWRESLARDKTNVLALGNIALLSPWESTKYTKTQQVDKGHYMEMYNSNSVREIVSLRRSTNERAPGEYYLRQV